ncbi:MAG: efflux RND transporter periplasmic adaptor subunit [Betaproteobacteria bacterium]|nr:efflux RND transporter periplasmic adaptor subunit [Betaproteobacteria bacterium]
MNKGMGWVAGGLALVLASGGGYWLGQRGRGTPGHPTQNGQPAGAGGKAERQVLYYRNPMGLPDTSPVPKKDPMGMDYIPVYAGDAPEPDSGLKISPEKVQKLGVRTEAVARRDLKLTIQAAGRVEPDERRLYTIAPKFEGWVERLYVNTTGQPVAKGQPLFDVYSPDLISAQREYAVAAEGVKRLSGAGGEAQAGMEQLAEASLARLKNWDISDAQVQALARGGQGKRTLTFASPVNGVVMDKKAVQGMRFMPGEALFQVADLSSVWVVADINERDIGGIQAGRPARVTLEAYPGQTFSGKVSYVYPTLKAETRTVPVRVELANSKGLLKPAMYATVELASGGQEPVLAVPASAVIDSGRRALVLVQTGEGRFAPREVKLGRRSDAYVEVLEGVREGEQVVVTANFLIDAESNLKAATGSLGAPQGQGTAQAATAGQAQPAQVGHHAEGRVEEFDAKTSRLSIAHGPVASLKWPAMTMEFVLANPALGAGLKPGAAVAFEFVERQPGEWVITKLEGKPAANPTANPHVGH